MFENKIKDVDKLQKEIDTFRPLNEKQLIQLKDYFKIGLTYSSNALEGNTLTEIETKVVIEEGITVAGKPLKDHYEAVGHGEAYDHMHTLVKGKNFEEKDILDLHRFFYEKVDGVYAGKYRDIAVIVTGTDYEFPAPSKVSNLMKKFVEISESRGEKLHPVEYAAITHIDFVNIHPFVDGNGRTARLLMNLILLQKELVTTIIPPVVRGDYLSAVRKGNDDNYQPFINFLSCMVYETQKDYLRLLKNLNKK